jgi:prolyl 4-hydroxylase
MQQVEVLSWKPWAFLYHNFLAKDECEYLINTARPHMERSFFVDSEIGKSMERRIRTSFGHFLNQGRDKIVHRSEKKGLQILHSYLKVSNLYS